MAKVDAGRFAATPHDGAVLFLIGMRINKFWKVHRWLPVARAMPRMLRELSEQPEVGLAHFQFMFAGRMLVVVQYWQAVEHLNNYARARDRSHFPAWREFNRRIGTNGDVGIFHETVVLRDGSSETVYGNMPPTLMGAAFGKVPARTAGQSAAKRMKLTAEDEPALPPPD